MTLKAPDDSTNTGLQFSTTHLATGVATGAEAENVCLIGPTGQQILPAALSAGTGSLKVSIEEDNVGSRIDTDDGSVASAQTNIALVIALNYLFDGANWVRGGWTPYKLNSAASTNATNVKNGPGGIGLIAVFNTNAAARFIKFYNKATPPTVGTDTPVQTYPIPGNTAVGGFVIPLPVMGLKFSTGISFALTTGVADSDTGAVAANEITVNLGWI
jgi:hypothetical protein